MPAHDFLIPVRRLSPRSGVFCWPKAPILASTRTADVLPLGQLAADLAAQYRLKGRIVRDATTPAAVRIRRDMNIPGPEAYRLTVSKNGIEILAAADAGAYYAVQTLRDLVAIHGRRIPACVINDGPDLARRGIYHDCSRGKVPKVATVKALVERLGHWKINELQLYTENVFRFRRHPAIGRGYSPFTADELLEIQDFCKLHHIRLVASQASFGHMEKILRLPQYIHLAELPGRGKWRGGSTLCPTDPGSLKLVAELFDELLPLFEAEDVNVCCDETWELGKGRSKKLADRIGIGRLYLEFLKKIHQLCEKHGKRMNAWADIVLDHPELLRELPKDIVMLNWDYSAKGKRIPRTAEIARAKMPFMVCPGTSGWVSHGTRMRNAVANVSSFAAVGRKEGAEGLLNTDWGDHGNRNFLGVSLHGLAHGAAHSWHGRGVNNNTFTETFCFHTFGQQGRKLSKALRVLGDTPPTAGGPAGALMGIALYETMLAPLILPKGTKDQIEAASPAGLRKVISQLSAPGLWPAAGKLDRFESLAMREFALAGRMDILACRRALAAKDIRAGKAVPAAVLRALAAETRRISTDFEKLWLARSKPSRLRDNMAMFRAAEGECLRLAKR